MRTVVLQELATSINGNSIRSRFRTKIFFVTREFHFTIIATAKLFHKIATWTNRPDVAKSVS